MGYTLIYRSRGRGETLAMPEFDSGAKDKGSDGRENRPLAERGQRGAIRLCPEPERRSGGLNPPEKEERKEPHARWHRA